VQIDTYSGLPLSDQYDAILSVSDVATRVTYFIPTTKTATARDLANTIFNEVCIRRSTGAFQRIQTDRAKTFASRLFSELMGKFGTYISLSTTATPTSQAIVERSHQYLTHYLRQFTNESGNDWSLYLDLASFAFNTSVHSVTGFKPLELLYGFAPQHPVQIGLEASFPAGDAADTDDRLARLAAMRKMAADSLMETADDTSLQEDSIVHPLDIKEGSLVFVHRSIFLPAHLRSEESCKVDLLYLGPVRVKACRAPNAYELEMPESFAGHKTVNIRFLKLCHNFSEVARDQQPRAREILDGDVGYLVSRILRHRQLPNKDYEFYVDWRGYSAAHRSWEPTAMFVINGRVANIQLRNYVGKHSIPIDLDNVPACLIPFFIFKGGRVPRSCLPSWHVPVTLTPFCVAPMCCPMVPPPNSLSVLPLDLVPLSLLPFVSCRPPQVHPWFTAHLSSTDQSTTL
jgi:hypothetical protein